MPSKTNNHSDLKIKKLLESLYRRYNHREFVPPDPLLFVYRFSRPADIEIAAFFASALAYGRVGHIGKSLSGLFERFGPHPADFVSLTCRKRIAALADFKHRFNTGDDIAELAGLLGEVIERFGSVERFFLTGFALDDPDILAALDSFGRRLLELYKKRYKKEPGRGVKFLLSKPANGGACKRLNLFLRWLVRWDEVDLGLWKGVKPSKLIVPVDVHMARLAAFLGFHKRRAADLRTAVQITSAFRRICPDDPARYDFALTRVGILEGCTGKPRQACSECSVLSFCQGRDKKES